MATPVYPQQEYGHNCNNTIMIGGLRVIITKTAHESPPEWSGIWSVMIDGENIPDRVSLQMILEDTIPRVCGNKYDDELSNMIKLLRRM